MVWLKSFGLLDRVSSVDVAGSLFIPTETL